MYINTPPRCGGKSAPTRGIGQSQKEAKDAGSFGAEKALAANLLDDNAVYITERGSRPVLRRLKKANPVATVLVEQPGVLAALSRRRSWVQIPSGTLDGTVRKPAKRPSSNLGD